MQSKYKSAMRKQAYGSINQMKSLHVPLRYTVNKQVVAEIAIIDQLPVLQVYTDNRKLAAHAIAALTAENFLLFYRDYMQFLPQLLGLTDLDKLHNYKKAIIAELDFSYVDSELLAYCAEINSLLATYRFQQRKEELPEDLRERDLKVEDLQVLLAMNDLHKGLEAGSSVVRTVHNADVLCGMQLLHTVDLPTLGVMGEHSLAVIRYTQHYRVNFDRPQKTFSQTFTPCLGSYSMANDQGLVITRNEATKSSSCRKSAIGIPESILIQELVENCVSVEEVLAYLHDRIPATSHILTLMDASGHAGVLEILPHTNQEDPEAKRLAYFRCVSLPHEPRIAKVNYTTDAAIVRTFHGDDVIDASQLSKKAASKQKSYGNYVHATNHFVMSTHIGSGYSSNPLMGSLTRASSLDRYRNMQRLIDSQASSKCVSAQACSEDTVQALRFYYDINTKNLKLTLTWGNRVCANVTKRTLFSRIDITQTFERFHHIALNLFYHDETLHDDSDDSDNILRYEW